MSTRFDAARKINFEAKVPMAIDTDGKFKAV
jgi:hypothetical protein